MEAVMSGVVKNPLLLLLIILSLWSTVSLEGMLFFFFLLITDYHVLFI
jgi:hypothetical protein